MSNSRRSVLNRFRWQRSSVSSLRQDAQFLQSGLRRTLLAMSLLRPSDSHFPELMQEIHQLLALYHQSVLLLGSSQSDGPQLRVEVTQTRKQCLKCCDTAKNCVLPQLKSENMDPTHSSEFTKKASQFIGSLNCFITEMKRHRQLVITFPCAISGNSATIPPQQQQQQQQVTCPSSPDPSKPGTSCQLTPTVAVSNTPSIIVTASGGANVELEDGCCESTELLAATVTTQTPRTQVVSTPVTTAIEQDEDKKALDNDIQEAETILDTIENTITVHFPEREPYDVTALHVPKHRRSRFSNLCLSCKTTYA